MQQEPFAFVTVICPPNSGFRTKRTAARAIYRKSSSLQCGPWVKGAPCGQTRNPSAGTKDRISVGETRWLSRPWAASKGKKGRCSGGGAGAPPPLPEASPCYSDGSPSAHSVVKGTAVGADQVWDMAPQRPAWVSLDLLLKFSVSAYS